MALTCSPRARTSSRAESDPLGPLGGAEVQSVPVAHGGDGVLTYFGTVRRSVSGAC